MPLELDGFKETAVARGLATSGFTPTIEVDGAGKPVLVVDQTHVVGGMHAGIRTLAWECFGEVKSAVGSKGGMCNASLSTCACGRVCVCARVRLRACSCERICDDGVWVCVCVHERV